MNLGIDIDGCLANFNVAYGNLLIKTTGVDLFPPGWETSPEFPGVWDWDSAVGYTPEQIALTWKYILQSPLFWEKLSPLPGAKDTVRTLNRIASKGHDVYFLTHRMGLRAKLQTEKWLYNLGMNYPTVMLSGNKAPLVQNLGINFFVDDRLENVNSVHLSVKQIEYHYLIDRPYNQDGRENGVKSARSIVEALELAGLLSKGSE